MKQLSKYNLKKKFWEGNTSVDEDVLMKEQANLSDADKAYFNFISQAIQTPENLEDKIWNTIHKKQRSSRKVFIQWTIAASILALVGLTGFIKQQRKIKLEQQFSLIEQTMNHVSYELTNTHSSAIIYEDNFIVIVAEN